MKEVLFLVPFAKINNPPTSRAEMFECRGSVTSASINLTFTFYLCVFK